MSSAFRARLSVISSSLVFITCTLFVPFLFADPSGFPRLIVVTILACFLLLAYSSSHVFQSLSQLALVSLLFMSFAVATSTLLSNGDFFNELIGNQGRYNGVISTSCFLIIFFVVARNKELRFENFFWPLLASGALSAVYGLVQVLEFDPVRWYNPFNYSLIVGTFGNPNHFSSFLSFFLVASVTNLKFLKKRFGSLKTYLVSLPVALITLSVLIENGSLQGAITLLIGLGMYAVIIVWSKMKRLLKFIFFLASICIFTISYLGFLGIGLLGRYLSTETGTYRGEYFLAGLRILGESPWVGIGAENFEEYFPKYRSEQFVDSRGREQIVDSSHNLLVDFALNYGAGFLIGLLIIITSCIWNGLETESKSFKNESPILLVPMFLSLLSQSLISTPHIVHMLWLWLILGFLSRFQAAGRVIFKIDDFSKNKKDFLAREKSGKDLNFYVFVSKVTFTMCLSIVLMQVTTHELRFQTAVDSRDGALLLSLSDSRWTTPTQAKFMVQVTYQAGYLEGAKELNLSFLDRFPRDFSLALLYYEQLKRQAQPNSAELEGIEIRMKDLDPMWTP